MVKEYLKGIWTVNGHSFTDRRISNTNVALLVSTYFTEPFDEPISYGRYIAQLANFIGKGVIVQRLGDLHAGRRSTHERIAKGIVQPSLPDATPGDLSFALPYRALLPTATKSATLESRPPWTMFCSAHTDNRWFRWMWQVNSSAILSRPSRRGRATM